MAQITIQNGSIATSGSLNVTAFTGSLTLATSQSAVINAFTSSNLQINGTSVLFLTGSNVGINNTTPQYALDVTGTIHASQIISASAVTASLYGTSSWATNSLSSSNAINSISSSYLSGGNIIASSISSSGNLFVQGNTTLAGNFTVLGTSSVINVSSSVIIGGNKVYVNAYSPFTRYAGLSAYDSGSASGYSSSIYWDSLNNYWLFQGTGDSYGSILSSSVLIGGPISQLGSEGLLTTNFIPKAQSGSNIANSLLSDSGTQLLYTGTSGISSSIISATGFTGSLFGTSSWAINAVSASYSVSSSYASLSLASLSASYASTASYVLFSYSSSYLSGSNIIVTSITASNISSSGAIIASAFTGAFSGSIGNAQTASYLAVGTYTITSSWANNALTASYVAASNVIGTVTSSSYSSTASYYGGNILNSQLPTQINVTGVSASFTGSLLGNVTGTSSLATNAVSSSTTITSANGIFYFDISTGSGFQPTYNSVGLTYNPSTNTLSGSALILTASVYGTSSWSTNSISSSYLSGANIIVTSITASNISSSGAIIASAFTGAFSGSIGNAQTASYLNGFANIVQNVATGSLVSYPFNLSGTTTTSSNIFGNINVLVSTGSAYGLVINASGSTNSYAISASGGISAFGVISGSNAKFSGSATAATIFGVTNISGAAITGGAVLSSGDITSTNGNFFLATNQAVGKGYIINNTAFAAFSSNVIGYQAGQGLTGAGTSNSNVFGQNAASGAGVITNANIFGQNAAAQATGGNPGVTFTGSNIFGFNALGNSQAVNYNYSANTNAFGYQAGYITANGNGVSHYSNFFGYQAGAGANGACNSIFIGYQTGLNDTVVNNNSIASAGSSSIAIGDYSAPKGFTNSITIGRATGNSAAAQANIGNVFWINGIQSTGTTPISTAITNAKVGIGTNNPNSTLQIIGNVSASNYTASSVGVGFLGTSSWANNSLSSSYSLTASYAASSANAFLQGGNSFAQSGSLGTNDGNILVIKTNNTTRLVVDTTSNLTSSVNFIPSADNTYNLGSSTSRFTGIYAAQSTIGALFETGLTTTGIGSLDTGTVLTWRGGKLIPSDFAFDEMVMGVTQKGHDEPVVFGAEPVLVTGTVNEGDYIVTSDKVGHGMGVPRGSMVPIDLFAKVIAQAIEGGDGDSYIIKAMIRKM